MSISRICKCLPLLALLYPLQSSSAEPIPYAPLTLNLTDQVPTGSTFERFRQQLRLAIQRRDATFLAQIASPDIKLTFGRPFPFSELNLKNPQAPAWSYLEKTVGTSCGPLDAQSSTWVCPRAFLASEQVRHLDPFETVFVVGSDVNVRQQPVGQSPIVTTLSHQVLKINRDVPYTTEQWQATSTYAGWTPVILPNGQSGFVASRYAFQPLGYRALFTHESGQWQMTVFIAGD